MRVALLSVFSDVLSASEPLRPEPLVHELPALVVAEVRVEVVPDARERLHGYARSAGEAGGLAAGIRRREEGVELAQLHEHVAVNLADAQAARSKENAGRMPVVS